MSLGSYIRKKREAASLTLRQLADALGVSAPFLLDVERDNRRLVPSRWPDLVKILPKTSFHDMAVAQLKTGTVTLDASLLTPKQRALLAQRLVETASRK